MKLVVQGAMIAALAAGCGAKSGGVGGGAVPVDGKSTTENGTPNEKTEPTPAVLPGAMGYIMDGSATTASRTFPNASAVSTNAITKLAMNDADYRLDITTGKRLDSVFFSNSTIEGSCAKDPSSRNDQQLVTGSCSKADLQGAQASADITGFSYTKTGSSSVAGYDCDLFKINLTTNVTFEGSIYAGTMTGDVCIAKKIPVKIGLVDFTKSVNGLDITVSSPAIRQKIEASAADLSGMIMSSTSSAEAHRTGIVRVSVATNKTTYTVTKVTAQSLDTATFAFPMAGYSLAN